MKTNGKLFTSSILAVALGSIPASNAALISVNFFQFTPSLGTAPVESTLVGPGGGLNTEWNQYADEDSTGTVVDSTGANTTVTFTTNFTEGRGGAAGNSPVFRASLTDFAKGTQNRDLIISGLLPNSFHDIWILAYRDNASAAERLSATWTVANPTTSSASQLLDSRGTSRNGTTFVEGYNFLLFSKVQANGSGVITFDADATLGPDGAVSTDDWRSGLSGFQILGVPEPSTAILGALGALALLRRRR